MDTNGAAPASVRVVREDPADPVLAIDGELDLASVGAVRAGMDPVLARGPQKLTLDLGGLTFMDSSGIALLIEASQRVPTVALVDVQPNVRRILAVTGLLDRFGLTP
jgi:anti-sigma B factor antagonist